MDSAHAPFAPSSLKRIELCPGSVRATKDVVEVQTPYSQDGNEAHDTLAYCLRHKIFDVKQGYAIGVAFGHLKPWYHRADTRQEREESIQDTLNEVALIMDGYSDATLYVETRVHFPSQITQDCWGTADIIIVVPSLKLLFVIDFKHGAGVFVDVVGNMQIGAYVLGAINTIPGAAECHTIIAGICQPRAFSPEGHYRTETQSRVYFDNVMFPRIEAAIAASMNASAPLVPGKEQCKFCPLKANCPAREAAALSVVGTNFASVKHVTQATLPDVKSIPVDRLAYIMAASEILEDWLKDVYKTAYALARQGVYVPGFKLVEASPRREYYQNEDITAQNLMMLTGKDLDTVYPRRLIGITEAEKLIVENFKAEAPRGKKKEAATAAKDAFALLTTKQTSGNLTLVPESDARPAVNAAQIAFANVTVI